MPRWHFANILQTGAGGRRLWQLSVQGQEFEFKNETTLSLSEPVPGEVVAKTWRSLVRRKLNVALLPADKVFIRVLHLPAADPGEIGSMVELQLEKLSPLPVTQIVWSVHILPKPADKPDALQPVIAIIVSRNYVEEFLGEMEGKGFLADHLEAPGLSQLLVTKVEGNGVWVYPGAPGEPALVAWWYDGTLHNLSLVALPVGPERGGLLRTQMEQIAWAGELDGWLTEPPKVHLIAAGADVAFWEPVLKEWAGAPIEVSRSLLSAELAALEAQRCCDSSAATNLLPPEYAVRYQQQFYDSLWMRGLMAIVAVYLVGVLAYFAAVYVVKAKYDRVAAELSGLKPSYNDALHHEDQIKILKDRQALKYAALDCWKAVAENLPESVTVDGMSFQRGRLELHGTASADDQDAVTTFNENLRHVMDPGHHDVLFAEVSPPTMSTRGAPAGQTATVADWRFNCQLKTIEKTEQ